MRQNRKLLHKREFQCPDRPELTGGTTMLRMAPGLPARVLALADKLAVAPNVSNEHGRGTFKRA